MHDQLKSAKVAFVRPPLPQNDNRMMMKVPCYEHTQFPNAVTIDLKDQYDLRWGLPYFYILHVD